MPCQPLRVRHKIAPESRQTIYNSVAPRLLEAIITMKTLRVLLLAAGFCDQHRSPELRPAVARNESMSHCYKCAILTVASGLSLILILLDWVGTVIERILASKKKKKKGLDH